MSKDKAVVDNSKIDRVLDDENRARIIDQLSEMGIPDPSALSDKDLIKKISDLLTSENKKRIQAEATANLKPLNLYAAVAHKDLKDKEFIERLFMLNIPNIYLVEFTDEDKNLKDADLWRIVSRSKILQYQNVRDMFRNRTIEESRAIDRDLPREFLRGR